MAFSFFKKKQPAETLDAQISEIRAATERNPVDPRPFTKLAELFYAHNRREEALQAYRKAARAAAQAGKDKVVISVFKHMLTLFPDEADIYAQLCDEYLKNHFIGDAVDVLLQQAGYYFDKNMKFEAAQVLKGINDIDPDNTLYTSKVEKFFKDRNLTSAEAERLGPQDKWLLVLQEARRNAGDSVPPGEFFDLEDALDTSSIYTISSASGSTQTSTSGIDPGRVFDKINSLMMEEPEQDPDFYFALAQAQLQQGNHEKAAMHAEKALASHKNRAAAHCMLMDLHRRLKRWDAAADLAKKAIKDPLFNDSERRQIQFQLGLVYRAQGDKKAAVKIFKKLYDQDNTFAQALNQLNQLK